MSDSPRQCATVPCRAKDCGRRAVALWIAVSLSVAASLAASQSLSFLRTSSQAARSPMKRSDSLIQVRLLRAARDSKHSIEQRLSPGGRRSPGLAMPRPSGHRTGRGCPVRGRGRQISQFGATVQTPYSIHSPECARRVRSLH
eukprot:scaffold1167_cov418-Prasinococcus_capsulatus_cf.AAC.25